MFHPNGPSLAELIRQGLSSTKKGYDLLASKFDHTPFMTSKEVVDFVAEVLSSEEKDIGDFRHAIDLCTGTGAVIEGLAPLVKKEIVGIDWSEPMLLEAKKKFMDISIPEIRFVCKDIFDIQFLCDYDLVTCFGALGHIERHRQKEFVDVIYSLLRPGGVFVFAATEKLKWHHFSTWRRLAFNAIMRVRNYFIKPEFVMYYFNFRLSEVWGLFTDGRWSEIKVISPENEGKESLLPLVIVKRA